jgi:hypothetical protein
LNRGRILILKTSSAKDEKDQGKISRRTFFLPFPLLFPPPPPLLFLSLNPFTSSSSTIEGGLIFFIHPCATRSPSLTLPDAGAAPLVTNTGSAEMTAVLDVDAVVTAGTNGASIVALVEVVVVVAAVDDTVPSTDAPTGSRGAVGFAF